MVLVEKPLSELFWDIFGKISTETTIKLFKNNNKIIQNNNKIPPIHILWFMLTKNLQKITFYDAKPI